MAYAQRLIATRRGAVLVAALAALLAGILIVAYVQRYRHSVNSEGAPVTVLSRSRRSPKGTVGHADRDDRSLLGDDDPAEPAAQRCVQRRVEPARQGRDPRHLPGLAAHGGGLRAGDERRRRVADEAPADHHGAVRLHARDTREPPGRRSRRRLRDLQPHHRRTRTGSDRRGGVAHTALRMIMSNVDVDVDHARAADLNFKVTDVQATKLAFAADNGKLWLALRPAAGAKTAPPSVVTVGDADARRQAPARLQSLGGRG